MGKRERASGLGQRAKSKRVKTDDTNNAQAQETQEEQATIAIDEDIDQDDELGQLQGLDRAYAQSDKSSDKLLRGIVHECDRLVRKFATGSTNDNNNKKLDGKFHDIYARALLELGQFAPENKSGDSRKDYIEAAIERANIGLETCKDDPQNKNLLIVTRAKARIALVDDEISSAKSKQRAKVACKAGDRVQEAIEEVNVIQEDEAAVTTKELVEFIKSVGEIADGFADLAEHRDCDEATTKKLLQHQTKLVDWTRAQWDAILGKHSQTSNKEICQMAHWGLAQYYVAKASQDLEAIEQAKEEDSDNENENKALEKETENAKKLLSSAQEHAKLALANSDEADNDNDSENSANTVQNGEIQALLGEVQISLANLYDNESPQQKELYAQAVVSLKMAQRLGYGNFQEQIADLEDDEEDDA